LHRPAVLPSICFLVGPAFCSFILFTILRDPQSLQDLRTRSLCGWLMLIAGRDSFRVRLPSDTDARLRTIRLKRAVQTKDIRLGLYPPEWSHQPFASCEPHVWGKFIGASSLGRLVHACCTLEHELRTRSGRLIDNMHSKLPQRKLKELYTSSKVKITSTKAPSQPPRRLRNPQGAFTTPKAPLQPPSL